MNNKLPDISYERNMNHNYMILTSRDYFGNVVENNNDYRKKMLLENNIPGLLPVKHRLSNGEMRYYYKINSLQSFESLYSKREINYGELVQILNGCTRIFERLEEYLLDGSQIILRPEFIYINPATMELSFVCYPEYEEDIRKAFVDFMDVILSKIDHTDNDAVLLSYKIYRYTKNPNYVISEIAHIMGTNMPQPQIQYSPMAQTEQAIEQVPLYQNHQAYQQVYTEEYEPLDLDTKEDKATKPKKEKAEIGIIACLVVAITAIGVILADSMTGIVGLKGDSELYLYGIIAVAMMEMVILLISRAKKKKAKEEALACEAG